MTVTTTNAFDRMRAFSLSMGLRRASHIVRCAKRLREAQTHGYADDEAHGARLFRQDVLWLREDVLALRDDGADAESITAILEAAFADAPELAELRAELIAKLTEAAGNAQEGGR